MSGCRLIKEEIMSRIAFLWSLFGLTAVSYIAAFVIGRMRAKAGKAKFPDVDKAPMFIGDRLLVRFKKWLNQFKTDAIKQKKWFRFCLLIFFNNLILAGLIRQTIYGIVFFVPYLGQIRTGYRQGIMFANPKIPMSPIFIFEFGGYLFCAAAGINLGLSFLFWQGMSFGQSALTALSEIGFFYIFGGAMLAVGAILETAMIASMSKLLEEHSLDFDKARELLKDTIVNK